MAKASTTIQVSDRWRAEILVPFFADERKASPMDPALWRDTLLAAVEDPARLDEYVPLKKSKGGHVFSARGPGPDREKFVAKYSAARGIKALAARFGRSRARRSVEKAHALLRSGLRTPIPFVVLERIDGTASWLITEFVEDLVDLDEVVMRQWAGADAARRLRVIREVARYCGRLHLAGHRHRDLKASNIMLQLPGRQLAEAPPDPTVWLVDLEGLVPKRAPDPTRALARLAASLADHHQVGRGDYLRFYREYALTISDSRLEIEDMRSVWRQAVAYNASSHRRKRGKLDAYSGVD